MRLPLFGTLMPLVAMVVVLFSSAGTSTAALLADYGDAPDGSGGRNYPSSFNSPNAAPGLNAPLHLDVTREWLGAAGPPTTTTTEWDSHQVDADSDDSTAQIFALTAPGVSNRGYLYTPVTYDPALSSAGDTRFLNAVVDFNDSGKWNDPSSIQNEWVVRNLPVDLSVLPGGKNTLNVFAGFELDSGLIGAQDVYTRVTLTTEKVPQVGNNDWEGSGPNTGFARGETEDFIQDQIFQYSISAGGLPGGGRPGGPLGFGPKGALPIASKFNPFVPVLGGHALTPVGPPVPVATYTFTATAFNADPGNAFKGKAQLAWTRICDIGPFPCTDLPFQGPNPVTASLGPTPLRPPAPFPSLALPGVGATATGRTGLLKPGLNTLTVLAGFPNAINGDTHTRLVVTVDPDGDIYSTYDSADDECGNVQFITPEPSSLVVWLLLGAVTVSVGYGRRTKDPM